jgi:hypothetical protein
MDAVGSERLARGDLPSRARGEEIADRLPKIADGRSIAKGTDIPRTREGRA